MPPPETAVTELPAVCRANMAINMFPLPVGATVTAQDAPEPKEHAAFPVTCCTEVIVACAKQPNSRKRKMVFTPVRLAAHSRKMESTVSPGKHDFGIKSLFVSKTPLSARGKYCRQSKRPH